MVDFSVFENELVAQQREGEVPFLKNVFHFAETAHHGQERKSGEPYIAHPFEVARILVRLRLDTPAIAAGLLHDVAEDTSVSLETIKQTFGDEIALLVEGVTKIGKARYPKIAVGEKSGIEETTENLRKLIVSMAKDLRVVLIKLADRLHNMRTLYALTEDKQQRIARETMEIYAPLAARFGIEEIKRELEDLSFQYLYPKEYRFIKTHARQYREREDYLKQVTPVLYEKLRAEDVGFLGLHYRAKSYWSLYQKLLRHNMEFDMIYDLIAVRVIVQSIEECYRTIGALHKLYRPLAGRFKDYIAVPKLNGYQSLHTTLFCEEGKLCEFQIRTQQMHEEAEYGIAAHWFYAEHKDQSSYLVSATDQRFSWLALLSEWQKKINDPDEFLNMVKIDFFKDRIFVFTPKGDVVDLPEGATPIDFAYRIHTELGNQCSGARVNERIVSLDEELRSGDVVSIVIQRNKKPSASWLEIVKTNFAKHKIKESLRDNLNSSIRFESKSIELDFTIVVRDRIGLIKDISRVISIAHFNIVNVNIVRTEKDPILKIKCATKDRSTISMVAAELRKVKSVMEVGYRVN
ncbi:MAG: RelA/SpoT family protein [Parcubacteria group bacterium]|nr:RelA/SpoT family protein [Parcubacteria group bacterium]